MPDPVLEQTSGDILIVTINRPERRNAVNRETGDALYEAFRRFDANDALSVAVLTGAGGTFCAGADLQAISEGRGNKTLPDGDYGPMGPTRLRLTKPVIAAIEGHAVAGGMELALWCDLRVMARTAIFGIYCRRFGVPLVDMGTVRLPRLIGQSRAMDLVLTGRPVGSCEALEMGLVNRVVDEGEACEASLALARQIAAFPQTCLRGDRMSLLEQWSLSDRSAMENEMRHGLATLDSGESVTGATDFSKGKGRHGAF
jgi:enoyl-CoA hydratase